MIFFSSSSVKLGQFLPSLGLSRSVLSYLAWKRHMLYFIFLWKNLFHTSEGFRVAHVFFSGQYDRLLFLYHSICLFFLLREVLFFLTSLLLRSSRLEAISLTTVNDSLFCPFASLFGADVDSPPADLRSIFQCTSVKLVLSTAALFLRLLMRASMLLFLPLSCRLTVALSVLIRASPIS